MARAQAGTAPTTAAPAAVFAVQLTNFSGPFDLLLNLISRRELDITEIALAQVTDEFIAHIRRIQAAEGEWKLDEASEFLVVAATLLDLKAARLLPSGAVEDEEDIALLEARDLLFARLLQYRAFKEVARHLAQRLEEEDARHPRDVPLEPHLTRLLPELIWKHTPADFAALAAKVLAPRQEQPSEVGIEHLHAPAVSVRDQAVILQDLLLTRGPLSFRQLTEDAGSRLVLVVRFLALLELFRDGAISFDQAAPLAELLVRWSAEDGHWSAEALTSDFEAEGFDSEGNAEGNSDAPDGGQGPRSAGEREAQDD
ncbi:chromosome segregation protein ScpA [Arthrobacter sp. Leaf234]|uniref:segregation and condensation protein A n=1 Tax=Arthrobacter sp. Leaf234 TaxID=1736303 RepID=UPI000700019C|nr:ScpA family protein [Arthrobacter sp. Leaf234]KQN95671.1 chromosome segregation protein ScpA [Arthrobacter sp. Leaf234]